MDELDTNNDKNNHFHLYGHLEFTNLIPTRELLLVLQDLTPAEQPLQAGAAVGSALPPRLCLSVGAAAPAAMGVQQDWWAN